MVWRHPGESAGTTTTGVGAVIVAVFVQAGSRRIGVIGFAARRRGPNTSIMLFLMRSSICCSRRRMSASDWKVGAETRGGGGVCRDE